MRTKILEAEGGGFYLKALLIRFTMEEWSAPSALQMEQSGHYVPLLRQEGWGPQNFYIALLSANTGGAMFQLGAHPMCAKFDVVKAPAVT